jgi:hypothetical protein
MKDPSSDTYIRRFHKEKVNMMLQDYSKNNYLTSVDCALLYGLTTKKKFNGNNTTQIKTELEAIAEEVTGEEIVNLK